MPMRGTAVVKSTTSQQHPSGGIRIEPPLTILVTASTSGDAHPSSVATSCIFAASLPASAVSPELRAGGSKLLPVDTVGAMTDSCWLKPFRTAAAP